MKEHIPALAAPAHGRWPESDRGPRESDAPPVFLLYSHDGFGIGHVQRNFAIASSIVRAAPEANDAFGAELLVRRRF